MFEDNEVSNKHCYARLRINRFRLSTSSVLFATGFTMAASNERGRKTWWREFVHSDESNAVSPAGRLTIPCLLRKNSTLCLSGLLHTLLWYTYSECCVQRVGLSIDMRHKYVICYNELGDAQLSIICVSLSLFWVNDVFAISFSPIVIAHHLNKSQDYTLSTALTQCL